MHATIKKVMASIMLQVACLWGVSPGGAQAELVSTGPFELYFASAGEDPMDIIAPDRRSEFTTSTRSFASPEKPQIIQAMRYWAERAPGAPNAINIYLGYSEKPLGSAFSMRPVDGAGMLEYYGISANGSIYDYFVNGRPSPLPPGVADNAIIYQTAYSSMPTRILLDDASSMTTMLHEMGHAMGIWGSIDLTDVKRIGEYFCSDTGLFSPDLFTAWNSHLVDIFGVAAMPDMDIEMITSGAGSRKEGVFQLYGGVDLPANFKYPTFHGVNVDALTGGVGMPVMGGYPIQDGKIITSLLDGGNALGHPGIMQSIMSYGLIRNMPFTEMELAAFQDMGYAMDRREFFGKSYYYAVGGDTQVNALGFGTEDAPNLSTFGLGTHIMRDNLTLAQVGGIYAQGYGGGGVRIDGSGNTLNIPSGVTVAADGDMGTGLLVSYGHANSINLDGTVRARGTGGIGAHFSIFAANNYIHSYTTYTPSDTTSIENRYEYGLIRNDLNGPLVSNFDIRGSLAGTQAAIEIGADAHVANITAHAGASISGNIISLWPRSIAGTEHATTLTLGAAGENGSLRVDGDINGASSTIPTYFIGGEVKGSGNALDVRQRGAVLAYNGNANVHSWDIAAGAELRGNSAITLAQGNALTNAGTIAPGNSIGVITINGGLTNTGKLLMEVDSAGSTDQLHVSGAFVHNTGAGGTVSVAPLAGYYADGSLPLRLNALFSGGTGSVLPTSIDALEGAASPTLRMSLSGGAGGTYALVASRGANAYSQYGTSGNAVRVGGALSMVGADASGDMQHLFATLDFSALGGSDVSMALPQLTAAAYGLAAQASAEANLRMGRMALHHLRAAAAGTLGFAASADARNTGDAALPPRDWSAWVMPFGGGSTQAAHAGLEGYNSSQAGLMGGLYRRSGDMSYGVYTALSRRQADMWTRGGAQARAGTLHLGAEALWRPGGEHARDGGWQAWAQAQAGVENTDMRRTVAILDYVREHSSQYTSFSGTAAVGGGYLWRAGELAFGPQIGLEYALNALPGVDEWGGGATRLSVDAYTRHDLRGVAGLLATWDKDLGEGRAVRATVDAAWRQDMLYDQRTVRGSFAGYGQYGFDTHMERQGQGSLGLAGGIQVWLRDDVRLSAQVEADVLRPGFSSVGGGLAVSWEF